MTGLARFGAMRQGRERTEWAGTEVGRRRRAVVRPVAGPQLAAAVGIAGNEKQCASGRGQPLRARGAGPGIDVGGQARARDSPVAPPQLDAVLAVRPGEVHPVTYRGEVRRPEHGHFGGRDRGKAHRPAAGAIGAPHRPRACLRLPNEVEYAARLHGPSSFVRALGDRRGINVRDLHRSGRRQIRAPQLARSDAGTHPDQRPGAEAGKRVDHGVRGEGGQLDRTPRRAVGPPQR